MKPDKAAETQGPERIWAGWPQMIYSLQPMEHLLEYVRADLAPVAARAAAEAIANDDDWGKAWTSHEERVARVEAIIRRHCSVAAAEGDRAGDRATLHCEFCGVGHVCPQVPVGEQVQVNNNP